MKNKIINKLIFSIIFLSGLNIQNFNINAQENSVKELRLNEVALNNNVYILGTDDILFLKFYDLDNYSGEFKISKSGNLYLPLIGSVNASGYSIEKLKLKLYDLYSSQLIDPNFDLIIIKERPIRVSVVGEVKNPGFHNLTENTFVPNKNNLSSTGNNISTKKDNSSPTLIDALEVAGGVTNEGDIGNITLIRKMEGQNNEYKKTNLNLLLTITEGNQDQNPFLFDGDIIKIRKGAKELSPLALSSSNITPAFKKVYVVGEVFKPGKVVLQNDASLSEAVMQAGGPKYFSSNTGNIQVFRRNNDGTITKKKYKLNLTRDLSFKKNPTLKDNDIVFVSRNSFVKAIGGINTITAPFSGIKNLIDVVNLLSD